MVGDSSNLVDLIRLHLTGNFSNRIFSLLGEDRAKAQSGMDAAVPGILSGLESAASTPDGSQRLSNAVDGADHTMLSKTNGMFGTASSSEGGAANLRSILGTGGFSELAGNIGQSSGLSGKGVTALLGFLAPIVLGVLKSVKRERGLDAAGLSSLLSSQKNSFAAAAPESSPAGRTVEPESYPREPLRDISSRVSEPEPVRAEDRYARAPGAGASPRSWTVPLVAFLCLLGLLWYWSSRHGVQAGREQQTLSEQAARPGTVATFNTLKSKYQSVIEMVYTQGGQLTALGQQDGKLLIKGTAPSVEAANRIWDQIKSINPKMDDITADFQVAEQSGTLKP
jgi:hypothetical protein